MAEIDRLRVASTTDFLKKILPVEDSTVATIYARVKADKLYRNGRWKGFPAKSTSLEKHLYAPFVKVANAITALARADLEPNEEVVSECAWKDYHSKPPQSLEADATKIRPDCVLAMGISGAAEAILEDTSVPVNKKESLWWLQFVAVVEAKRSLQHKDQDAILQLLGYLRLMMVEQKDRRFALGLYISFSQCSVWMQDRSGVLAMDVPINIHKDPKSFIHLIAALAILPAHRLGFDPTMRLARANSSPIPTYRLSSQGPNQFDIGLYKRNNYATQWVISTENNVYLTLKALSLLRTDVVHGSGSMVWAAILYEDREKKPDERAVYVLKQWWRSEGQEDEGAIYEHLRRVAASFPDDMRARYIGELKSHETVKIQGESDSTHSLIQRGIESAPAPQTTHSEGHKRRRSIGAEDREMLHVETVTQDDVHIIARFSAGTCAKSHEKRTRMRLVLKMFGCSIRFFASLPELIELLLHCVHGHHFAYTHGVLQRDISPANLLITLIRDGQRLHQDIQGCLIDFDHASRIASKADRSIRDIAPCDDELLSELRLSRRIRALNVADEVLKCAIHVVRQTSVDQTSLSFHGAIDSYIAAAVQYNKVRRGLEPQTGQAYTPELLGWDTVLLKPSYPLGTTPQQAIHAPRSGTPPYASAFIINDKITVEQDASFRSTFVIHDAVHDMESFFWVLLYLAITRSGPGGGRREELIGELTADHTATIRDLRVIVYSFFDGNLETIAWNKKELFENGHEFEPLVLCHVHPYFARLKPLLLRWWHLLVLAYQYKAYEYHDIHKFVIALLEEALCDLRRDNPAGPDDERMTQDAISKRAEFVRKITHVGLNPPPQARPTSPPQSPTQHTFTIALDNSPESQRLQRQAVQTSGVPSSPTSPSPVPKKLRPA